MIQFNETKTTAPGVYMILNLVTNARYVGSSTLRLANRFSTHRCILKKHQHENQNLQAAWDQYGSGAFKFVALENTTKECAKDAEQKWYDLFKSQDVPLYNIYENVVSSGGYRHSEETKAKLSAIGSQTAKEAFAHIKTYTLVSPSGEAVSGQNLSELARRENLDFSALAKLVRGQATSHKGWTAPEARAAYLIEHPLKRPGDGSKNCEVCGKPFHVQPSTMARRFCSSACRSIVDKQKYAGEGNPNYRHGGRVTGVKRIRHRASLP